MATRKKKVENIENAVEEVFYEDITNDKLITIFDGKEQTEAEIQKDLQRRFSNADKKNKSTQLFLQTGCTPFDLAVSNGKGLPIGCAMLFYAERGTGKTTLIADVLYRILKRTHASNIPYKVLYIDIEGSGSLLESMGLGEFIEDGSLKLLQMSVNFKQLDVIYKDIVLNKEPFEDIKLIVIDSINTVVAPETLQNEITKAEFGNKAKYRGKFYEKYLPICFERGITNIFISQVRQEQGATMYQEAIRPAVTSADLHWVDVVMKLTKQAGKDAQVPEIEDVKKVSTMGAYEDRTRYIMKFASWGASAKNLKNRFFKAPELRCLAEYGKGINNWFTLRLMLVNLGFFVSDGGKPAKYTITEEIKELFDASDIDKETFTRKELNDLCKKYNRPIIDFLESRGLYKLVLEDTEEE